MASGARQPEASAWDSRRAAALQRLTSRIGTERLQQSSASWRACTDEKQKDGMILAALADNWSYVEVVAHFGVGAGRVKRIRSANTELPAKRTKYDPISDADLSFVKTFVCDIKAEPGLPCAHRKAREYVEDGSSFRALHKDYSKLCSDDDRRAVSWYTFFYELRKHRPFLRPARLRQDVCNVCFRIHLQLQDPDLHEDDATFLREQKDVHIAEAVAQRREMNRLVLEHTAGEAQAEPPCLDDLLSGSDDDDDEDGERPHSSPAADSVQSAQAAAAFVRTVGVQCEDFGQSISMPTYGLCRPNADYFHSDLHVHMFVIANVSVGKDSVLLYDERTAGKGADAMCSLRWHYHSHYLGDCARIAVPPVKHIVQVMDNCVGQNKSASTFLFEALLSILLYESVTCMFLLPGHSHMRADTVVANAKKPLRRQNIYHPDDLVARMQDVARLAPQLLTAHDFCVWEPVLNKYFKRPPAGFTGFYYCKIERGVACFKRLASTSDSECVRHEFCAHPELTRTAILQEIFGLGSDATVQSIAAARVLLQQSPPLPLKQKKIDSLSKKYDCIPARFRCYYPVPDTAAEEPTADVVPVPAAKPAPKPPGRPRIVKVDVSQPSMLQFFKPRE